MTPRLRKLALTAHVTSSVGWLGAVMAYLALAIAGLRSEDARTVRAAYLSMDLIGWYVIVPCGLAALLTGLVQSLATEWGLFRHHWVVAKLVLTTVGLVVLLVHMRTVSRVAAAAAEATLASEDVAPLRLHVIVHAAGGLVLLLTAAALSVFKPWGKTARGRRQR
jgi:hypothetical protein